MGTLVSFHAHPDDEAILTGGSIAKYAALGHRVVLVVATSGEHGQVPPDLSTGETLGERRRAEVRESARVLGVSDVHFLGYEDSGMDGWEQNVNPAAFCRADREEAAARLAAILTEVGADVLTTYDEHGGYGHPDHIQVHHVGHRAAALAGTPAVYEATINRDAMRRFMEAASAFGIDMGDDAPGPDDVDSFGMPEDSLTTVVDVADHVDAKWAALACHRSQVDESSFFRSLPMEAVRVAFGTEWFIRTDRSPGALEPELALPPVA